MVKRGLDQGFVAKATREEVERFFGGPTLVGDMLIGRIAGRLYQLTDIQTDQENEFDWNAPPDYALRAINTSSAGELLVLIENAAQRLSKSIATYCDAFHGKETSPNGRLALSPYIFREGSHEAAEPVGQLRINVNTGSEYDRTVAELYLEGGEESPIDPFKPGEQDVVLSQILTIRKTTMHDPVSGMEVPTHYIEVTVQYSGKQVDSSKGTILKAVDGASIGPEGLIAKANIFLALDAAIAYYENVYNSTTSNTGITYADLRDANCLDENLKENREFTDLYVRQLRDEGVAQGIEWLRMRDDDDTVLVIDPHIRAQVEQYKAQLRRMVEIARNPQRASILGEG